MDLPGFFKLGYLVLIVPSGIETQMSLSNCRKISTVLIVPSGIETIKTATLDESGQKY